MVLFMSLLSVREVRLGFLFILDGFGVRRLFTRLVVRLAGDQVRLMLSFLVLRGSLRLMLKLAALSFM